MKAPLKPVIHISGNLKSTGNIKKMKLKPHYEPEKTQAYRTRKPPRITRAEQPSQRHVELLASHDRDSREFGEKLLVFRIFLKPRSEYLNYYVYMFTKKRQSFGRFVTLIEQLFRLLFTCSLCEVGHKILPKRCGGAFLENAE